MTGPAPCGRPDCPVPAYPPARGLRSVVWPAGTRLRRGYQRHHRDPAELVPGVGDTRFAPLAGAAHVYLATTSFAALLESAFHNAAPPAPALPRAVLARWAEAEVALRHDVRLIDLRDPELDRLGINRHRLVATSAAHYACTSRWAAPLHGRVIGGQTTHGLVWHSRQAELHARAMAHRPALQDLLDYHPADVAVLWAPPAPTALLQATGEGLGTLTGDSGHSYVADLTALLEIVTM